MIASKLHLEQDEQYDSDDSGDRWKWSVWLEGPGAELDQVKEVIYTLHSTFQNPVRRIMDRKTKFRLSTQGWGVFRIYAEVRFRSDDREELYLYHDLHLTMPQTEESSLPRDSDPVSKEELDLIIATANRPRPAPLPAKSGSAPARIFISHQPSVRPAVEELRRGLLQIAGDRLMVRTSSDVDWLGHLELKERLETELASSDLMLVLLSGSGERSWDQSYFEWGFFNGSHGASVRRSMVVRSPAASTAAPLSATAEYVGDLFDIHKLLVELLTTPLRSTDPPIFDAAQLTDSTINPLARAMLRAVGDAPSISVDFSMMLFLDMAANDIRQLERGQIPPQTKVRGCASALEMLGLLDAHPDLTWEQIEDVIHDPSIRSPAPTWSGHFAKILWRAANSQRTSGAIPVFFSRATKSVYRPSLTKMEKRSDGSCVFAVDFTELPRELSTDTWPPGALGVASHLLTLSRMFRWGVLIPYMKRFRGLSSTPKDSRPLDLAYEDLDVAIANVIVDSQNRGLTLEGVEDALPPSEIEKFDALIKRWEQVYHDYRQLISGHNRTAEDMLRLLDGMADVNAGFLRMFTYVSAELVGKSLDQPV